MSDYSPEIEFTLSCPIPIAQYPHILMAHGGGGKLMHHLIGDMFSAALANPYLQTQHDGAVIQIGTARLAFTTDSHVVNPLFFPGGDIGKLAVYGTVNDLAMCGARPLFLSLAVILEEGLPMERLWQVVQSIQQAAIHAGVQVITGDTKVVDRGKGDGIFINTAGIGLIEHDLTIAPQSIQAGDVVLLSGDVGRHGIAIMAMREGLEFETTIESDCALVAGMVLELLAAGIEIHCLRDLTRGGLATALIEIAQSAGQEIHIEEKAIPVEPDVRGACEILGLDPLYVANEGRFIAIVKSDDADRALDLMHRHMVGTSALRIGEVRTKKYGRLTMQSVIGVDRILDMLSGEQLPRIC